MAKRKYTQEERNRLGIQSRKNKRQERFIYDDEVTPRRTKNFEHEAEESPESGGSSLVFIGLTALIILAALNW